MMTPKSISVLIIHPEDEVLDRFKRCITASGCQADIQCRNQIPQEGIHAKSPVLIIADEDIRMPEGVTLWEHLVLQPPARAIILISHNGSIRRAVESVRIGVKDYLLKNSPCELVQAAVQRALTDFPDAAGNQHRGASKNGLRPMVFAARVMQDLLSTADRVASANATVLIQGESGTGKELLARYIHHKSPRNLRPFLAINCAALPEHLAESELFGYEKGAFTGAGQKRAGKFEQAHNSTLLLDEISEMPMNLQVKLLRVLQEKVVDHIGGKAPIAVDTRIIATTNRNLVQMVKEGTFREDLFYRLRVIPLKIPPLRQRREDIPLLVRHFLNKHGCQRDDPTPEVSPQAMERLNSWSWPGNVRELENTIERTLLIGGSSRIEPHHLMLDEELCPSHDDTYRSMVGNTVREMERKLIGQTLEHLNQNRTHAAKMLGISIRTLRNKLKEYQQPGSTAGNPAP